MFLSSVLLPGDVICNIDAVMHPEVKSEYQPSKLIVCFAEEAEEEVVDGDVVVKLASVVDGGMPRVFRKENAFSFMKFHVDPDVTPTKGMLLEGSSVRPTNGMVHEGSSVRLTKGMVHEGPSVRPTKGKGIEHRVFPLHVCLEC